MFGLGKSFIKLNLTLIFVMKRLSQILLFLIASVSAVSQESFVVSRAFEYSPVTVESGEGNIVLGFSCEEGYWDASLEVPKIVIQFPLTSNDYDYAITGVSYSDLSSEEKRYCKVNYDVIDKSVTRQGKSYFGVIEMSAIQVDAKDLQLKKVTSIDLSITPKSVNKLIKKSYTSSSVLSNGSGDWYKIGVTETGLHKVNYSFLEEMGVDLVNLASSNINVYGNGQGMLDEDNSVEKIDDIILRDIIMQDGGDGIFDPLDYFIFYANGPHDEYLSNDKIRHESNNFTDTAYYFINVNSGTSPARVSSISQSSQSVTHTVNKFNHFEFLEIDARNLAKSGQEWLGDLFDVQLNNSYSFDIANLSASDSVDIGVRIGISTPTSFNDAKFTATSNGSSMIIKPTSGSGQGSTSPKARLSYNSYKVKQSSGNITVSLTFDKDGLLSSKGYLDYIELNCVRNLKMDGSQMLFYHIPSVGLGNVAEFQLTNAQNVSGILDVTDNAHPRLINVSLGNTISYKAEVDTLRKFVAYTDGQLLTPNFFGKIDNQNLHGLSQVDLLIISAPEFLSAAYRLADHHSLEGLSSHVVTQQQIFNEFSSGMRDPVAIRHFVKMFYERAGGNPLLQPKFCLLLGDCTYDYRNRLNSNSDYVITYESKESMSTATYSTDDFYVILDDSEIMRGTDLMDLAVGRIPVQTIDEANAVVDKIIAYSTINEGATDCDGCSQATEGILGDWRNMVLMVSDDSDNNAYFNDVENMDQILSGTHPELNVIKIHSDSYLENVTPGGERNPGAQDAIQTKVERGALLINYIGHGGELGWAHEEILNNTTINSWSNSPRLPVFMTATCEFSRYDDHDRVSAGEYVVLNENGGGIALFTTTRLVYTTTNRQLAKVFYDTVADKVNGKPQYIGDIYKGSKNKFASNFGSTEARKFTFLGDPAVRYSLPYQTVKLDSINGVSITSFSDTLKALSQVKISGHLEDNQGNLMSGFNGFVYPTIYDKKSQLSTMANSSGSYVADFEMWKNVIYKGKATVKNGYYSSTFIIPQDISYSYGKGRVSLYAEDGSQDGNGYDESPTIGGINSNAPSDSKGPEIELYLNNSNFVDGGITDATPVIIAKFFDENGINMVGNGIGHNIEFWLDESSESTILNDYYEADVDTYQSGQLSFQLNALEAGEHTLRLKVWDVYNNSSETSISFIVVENEDVAINNLINYPNPFTTRTQFSFEHNQVCDYLDVQIQIFTISGKLVKTIQERIITDGFYVGGIEWDGRDDFGEKIAIGTYVYKVTIQNESGNSLEKFEKLFILN